MVRLRRPRHTTTHSIGLPVDSPGQGAPSTLAVCQFTRMLPESPSMKLSVPHYVLYSEVGRDGGPGRWWFSLRRADGSERIEAADVEPRVRGERLDLLTVVRALESLDQPSRVTLVGCSRYVRRGMQYGLSAWRSNGWRWECFGQMVPVKNGDLWQRMDRAMRFHRVECCHRRFDPPHQRLAGPQGARRQGSGEEGDGFRIRLPGRRGLRYRVSWGPANWRRRLSAVARLWRRRVLQSWTTLIPVPRAG